MASPGVHVPPGQGVEAVSTVGDVGAVVVGDPSSELPPQALRAATAANTSVDFKSANVIEVLCTLVSVMSMNCFRSVKNVQVVPKRLPKSPFSGLAGDYRTKTRPIKIS